LTTKIIQKDARVHCAVLKLRPVLAPSPQRLPTPNPKGSWWAVRPSGTSPQSLTPHPHPKMRPACVATPRQQPSGCSLRTQQRAQPTPNPSSHRSHPNPERLRRTRRHQLESRPQSMFHPRAPSPTRSAGTTGLDTLHHP
jgi:hypothetical protein